MKTMKTMKTKTSNERAGAACSSEFESVGSILARVLAERGDIFTHRLKQARLNESRAEGRRG
jgi:hypothetical protein